MVFAFAYNAKRFANAFLFSLAFSPSRQCFWTDWQKLFLNICAIAAMICRVLATHVLLEVNSNGGLKREHLEFSSLATKNISPLPQCLWPPSLAGW